MILIISSEYDVTTNKTIAWLSSLNAKYTRLNSQNVSSLDSFHINNNSSSKLKINSIDSTTISVIWHRRGRLRHIPLNLNNFKEISHYLKKEEDSLIKSIEFFLKHNSNYIGSYLKEIENYKINHLLHAKKVGLTIPKTLITTKKNELFKFYSKHKKIITKDIRYPVQISFPNGHLSSSGTFILKKDMIDTMNSNFAPILIQKYIEKQFEIRCFYHDKLHFAMAIFSQNDDKTKIDYRNYNDEIPNRCVPFDLPLKIVRKLNLFMELSELRTGSVDLIYTKTKEYVFLEVNPMGQFDWLSKNCNYYIEKNIAKNLINNEIN